MHEQEYGQITAGFRRHYIRAREFSQVLRFVSLPQRTVYINVCAEAGAKIIKLSFNDKDLLRI